MTMFNPKLDMKDSEEKAKPLPDWAFKKKSDNSFLYAGLSVVLMLAVLLGMWATGIFSH